MRHKKSLSSIAGEGAAVRERLLDKRSIERTDAGEDQPDWNSLVSQYAIPAFITKDPISFPHAHKNHADWRVAECVAFLSALLSHGSRTLILKTLNDLYSRLGENPLETVLTENAKELEKRLNGFYYRFNTASDMHFVLQRLAECYRSHGSLKTVWGDIYQQTGDLKESIHRFRHMFLHEGDSPPPESYGMKFLLADPSIGSACKRFNMFLRWMVRSDAVDLGLWADVMMPASLIIPLDTHVARMARQYKITQRKSNDWKTASEITRYFSCLDPVDPVKYDFALFGVGIESSMLL